MCRIWLRRGGCIVSWWGNRCERDQWGGLVVEWCIMIGRISGFWHVGIWTALDEPTIETDGGSL